MQGNCTPFGNTLKPFPMFKRWHSWGSSLDSSVLSVLVLSDLCVWKSSQMTDRLAHCPLAHQVGLEPRHQTIGRPLPPIYISSCSSVFFFFLTYISGVLHNQGLHPPPDTSSQTPEKEPRLTLFEDELIILYTPIYFPSVFSTLGRSTTGNLTV